MDDALNVTATTPDPPCFDSELDAKPPPLSWMAHSTYGNHSGSATPSAVDGALNAWHPLKIPALTQNWMLSTPLAGPAQFGPGRQAASFPEAKTKENLRFLQLSALNC